MADLKKFLDQGGVSTLWSRIAEEVKKVDDKAVANAAALEVQAGKIQTMEGKITALEAGTYDDTAVRTLIGNNTQAIGVNAAAIEKLNGDAETVGSVANTATTIAAAKVAEIVAGANADFDTLKEIADWILNDTTGAADMANDIKALENKMAGVDETVVKSIADAIDAALKVEGTDKFALAADLTALAGRVKTLEDAGFQNAEQVGSAIDAKIAALKLANSYDTKGAAAAAETAAKAYADGLAVNYATAAQGAKADTALQAADIATGATNGAIAVKGTDVVVKGLGSAAFVETSAFDAAGTAAAKAAAAQSAAESYADGLVANIQALTTAEIDAAITAAKA